ncbi:hypothetical protein [Pseudoalteromonas sp. DY56-GL79]|uniref:hypothetical protein n=1 Tax=Pseudoalteromonas sp. DY56-GL79 TaxID=2967131 RepID=UPI00352A54B9
MLSLNKADKEILSILKEIYLTKKVKPLQSDEHFRIWLVRVYFYLGTLCLLYRLAIWATGQQISAQESSFLSFNIAMFFGVLFFYINHRSENSSVIVFSLTWLSIICTMYV